MEHNCGKCAEKTLCIYSRLNDEEARQLACEKIHKKLKKNDVLFKEGFTTTDIVFVKKGLIKVSIDGHFGRDSIVRFVKKGEILGHESIVSGNKHFGTAKAMEDSEICIFHRDLIDRFLYINKPLSEYFFKSLIQNLSECYKKITDLSNKTVKSKVAGTLLSLVEKNSEITILREDLAQSIASTRETVTRVLSELKKEKLIEIKGKKIVIINSCQLENISKN